MELTSDRTLAETKLGQGYGGLPLFPDSFFLPALQPPSVIVE